MANIYPIIKFSNKDGSVDITPCNDDTFELEVRYGVSGHTKLNISKEELIELSKEIIRVFE